MEDATSLRPVSVYARRVKEAIALLEQVMVRNQPRSVFLAHGRRGQRAFRDEHLCIVDHLGEVGHVVVQITLNGGLRFVRKCIMTRKAGQDFGLLTSVGGQISTVYSKGVFLNLRVM